MARRSRHAARRPEYTLKQVKLLLIAVLLGFFSGALAVIFDGWSGIYFALCPGPPHLGSTLVLAAMPLVLFMTFAVVIAQVKKVSLKKKDRYKLIMLLTYIAVLLAVWAILVWTVFLQGQYFCPSPIIAQYPQGILQCYKVGSSWSCWSKT
jgi:hypothetical protein